jgi:hypothetical protein
MPLPIGNWTAVVNGTIAQLQINSVNADGFILNADFSIPAPQPPSVQGIWDEDAQKLLLFVSAQGDSGALFGIFAGYLFTDPVNLTGVTGSVIFTLSGEVECFVATGLSATAKRSSFGWYAQIGID